MYTTLPFGVNMKLLRKNKMKINFEKIEILIEKFE